MEFRCADHLAPELRLVRQSPAEEFTETIERAIPAVTVFRGRALCAPCFILALDVWDQEHAQ